VIDGPSDLAVAAARRRLAPAVAPAPGALTSLPARRGARVVVVAGPGVLAARARSGLVALVGITGATVVSTVGAKGLLRWDDPRHGGTVGLQAGDAQLAEVATADLVVTTGLDPRESVGLTTALRARAEADPASVVDVHPAHLALAAGGWPPAEQPGPRPPLYDRLAAVVGPLYEAEPAESGAVPPPAAAAALAAGLPPGGLVVAPPGPAGFWIGRTFPTTEPGSVMVPIGDPPGTAAAVALLAARAGRPTTLVVAEVDQATAARAGGGAPGVRDDRATVATVLAAADGEGLSVAVETWRGAETAEGSGPGTGRFVDWSVLDPLVAVAGPPDDAIWPDGPT